MSEYDATTIESLVRERLREGEVEVTVVPARDPNRFHLWAVGEGVSEAIEALLSDLPELEIVLAGVQAYETRSEADEWGVSLVDAFAQRTDWLTRAQAVSTLPLGEPSYESPLVVTFYSFRGGVGRTTALAHTATILAQRGLRVIMVDADLEAPGLHHAFGVQPRTADFEHPLLDLLSAEQDRARDQSPDVREYLVQIPGFDDLFLLPAGEAGIGYLAALDRLQLRSWTLVAKNPVADAIRRVAESQVGPDVILVDARTGFADSNAPFLFGGSDHAVIAFYPSEQSQVGANLVARALTSATSWRGRPIGTHFVASPIPSGKGSALDPGLTERAKQWATDWVSEADGDVVDPDFVAVPYSEALAMADRVTDDPALLEPYRAIADWLDPGDSERHAEPNVAEVRRELRFTAGNSDSDENVLRLFVRTEDAERLQSEKILLVEGRKGTGKTTLFRWLTDEADAIPITSPESLRTATWWPRRETWAGLAQVDPGFHRTWPVLIALRVAEEVSAVGDTHTDLREMLERVKTGGVLGLAGEIPATDDIATAELMAADLMVRALSALPEHRRLVFDGLDTTFGFGTAERTLRDEAIGTLLPLLMDREASLPNADFTVFVRTDIVRSISFANQSHLFGRRLTLSWDKQDYLKTILKQALETSPSFATQVGADASGVDDLTDDQTLSIWQALIGVRVRGKQTAFTDRWVWTRLADGNGDHSPRHLAQLFRALSERARLRGDETGAPLRARDLGIALAETVSQEALTALHDEFPEESETVIPIFKNLDISPFIRSEWEAAGGSAEQLALGQVMGVIAEHPRDRDRLIVPELYRYALDVRRRGPA